MNEINIVTSERQLDSRLATPGLAGVHHTARPTWKLAETVHFYRDVMGLPLVHAITARGWGQEGHPDFLHFFFESGKGSTIAFFYYIGTSCPENMEPHDDYLGRSPHTAWQVDSLEELRTWRRRLEGHGVKVSPDTQHEVITSIYFHDPNGYFLEITVQTRPFVKEDASDATLTMEAAVRLEAEGARGGTGLKSVDDVWRTKAQLIEAAARGA
jgi:catechol 2,3-dioxygenase-like lactoylglutathione lyase family enzyme